MKGTPSFAHSINGALTVSVSTVVVAIIRSIAALVIDIHLISTYIDTVTISVDHSSLIDALLAQVVHHIISRGIACPIVNVRDIHLRAAEPDIVASASDHCSLINSLLACIDNSLRLDR
jgi:hypothetical protein